MKMHLSSLLLSASAIIFAVLVLGEPTPTHAAALPADRATLLSRALQDEDVADPYSDIEGKPGKKKDDEDGGSDKLSKKCKKVCDAGDRRLRRLMPKGKDKDEDGEKLSKEEKKAQKEAEERAECGCGGILGGAGGSANGAAIAAGVGGAAALAGAVVLYRRRKMSHNGGHFDDLR